MFRIREIFSERIYSVENRRGGGGGGSITKTAKIGDDTQFEIRERERERGRSVCCS